MFQIFIGKLEALVGDPATFHMVDCLAIIERRLPALSGANRRIAEMVVSDPWAVLRMTGYDLAVASNVSQPTITRFCRTMGYPGFRELLQGLAQSLGRIDAKDPATVTANPSEPGGLAAIAAAIASHQIEGIQATQRSLDFETIDRAAAAIAAASRVSIVGHGAAHVTTSGIAFKLNWAGIFVCPSTPDVFCNQAIALGSDDVVIGVSFQGRTRDTIESLRLAKSLGATTIGISAVAHSPMMEVSDVMVSVLTPAIARTGTFLVTNSALMFLADILATAVAERRWGGVPPKRNEVVEWIETTMRVGPVPASGRTRRLKKRSTPGEVFTGVLPGEKSNGHV